MNLDCNNTFLIFLAPNGILFDADSNENVLKCKFGLIWIRINKLGFFRVFHVTHTGKKIHWLPEILAHPGIMGDELRALLYASI